MPVNNRLNPDDANISPIAVGAATAAVSGAVFYSHKALLANSNTYAKSTYDFFKTIEDKSPASLIRTLRLSEHASSYLPDRVHVPYADLFHHHKPTQLAEHFNRLIGSGFNATDYKNGLTFTRHDKSSAYLHLNSDPSIKVRFAEEGASGASSFRYGSPVSTTPYKFVNTNNPIKDTWSNFQALRHGQDLRRPTYRRLPDGTFRDHILKGTSGIEGAEDFRSISMYPYLAEREGKTLSNVSNKAARVGFESLERTQKLLADFGVGLKAGSYNKIFHVPFIGQGKGIVNELLSKRVLPAYLALGVALPYVDHLLHHAPSNAVINAYQAVSVGRAKLTDDTPYGRKITDTYSKVVPGPQYGPLALPLGGMFAGALVHYKDVLTDKFPTREARAANIRILAHEGEETLFKFLNKKSPIAKGLAIGASLMLPFIPGMLGSRKSAGELEDIYSGAEPVPVKSGRWWEVGLTPFGGSTIKSFRPHWSVLWKAQAEKASIYGGEDNYWSHHPLLHPFKAFKDPYWLEKQNYRDRPYPITSPAFSNVPLIGSFLAATIGKLVKPVVRMHTDEWDGKTDYNLYSTRLEPKGPRVESKFEREVLQQLSEHGFKANTQTPIDGYRADFTLQGNGHKVVIESDGDTYHTKWNAKADATRQKDIEAAGWEVLRVRSTPFFSDPSEAMDPVFARLSALGINPQADGGNINSGLVGYANPVPKEEFGLGDTLHREAYTFSDFIGLPGFIGRSIYDKLFPDDHKDVYLQGSRNIDSTSRRYYERELGAGYFASPEGKFAGLGYSEPLRRFIQPDLKTQQANEISNSLADVDWIPGEDYYIDYKKGDPYSRIEDGYARLPGAGYEALHPELKGIDPNDYPDIDKLSILADIGPYSRQYQAVKGRVAKAAANNTDLSIEYSRILDRVQQIKDSALGTTNRIFSGETESISATVDEVNAGGFTTKEYPGRSFRLSGLGTSAADMAAIAIGENNSITRSALDNEVDEKRSGLGKYLQSTMGAGTKVKLTVPFNSINNSQTINAVVQVGSRNVNSDLIDQGYARFDRNQAGPEAKDIFGGLTKALGTFGEEVSFTGDEEVWNPLRYIPTPMHTKLWQNRDPLADYQEKEVYGSTMRRWDKPLHDFVMPYARGAVKRTTGYLDIPEEVQEKRSLNAVSDSLKYLRSKILANTIPGERSKYTNQGLRTFEGVDLFSEASYVASTLPRREALYFMKFVKETDPDKRESILASVSKPTAEALQAQWLKAKAGIAQAEGKDTGPISDGGRTLTKEGLESYKHANTKLSYGDFTRSLEIAKVFTDRNYQVPSITSDVFSPNIDYDDVKLKIIQLEGYDAKDFNIFDDRSSVLWRKPYIDGAVSELTSGVGNSLEENRKLIESILIASNNKNPKVSLTSNGSRVSSGIAQVNIERDDQDKLLSDMRRRPEQYN